MDSQWLSLWLFGFAGFLALTMEATTGDSGLWNLWAHVMLPVVLAIRVGSHARDLWQRRRPSWNGFDWSSEAL